MGKVLVPVTIADCQYPIVCIVVEVLSYPLILGWNGFLVEYQAVIDSATNIVRLLRPSVVDNSYLYLHETVILPPFTECLASVNLYINKNQNTNDIFISRYDPLFIKTGLTVLPGIYNCPKERVPQNINIVLTNLSPQNLSVAKHTIVAFIKPFEDKITRHLNTISDNNDTKTVNIDTSLDELNTEEQGKVRTLLNKYCNLFIRKENNNIASNVVHQIDTELSKPIHCPPQRLGFQEREHIHSQVADMLKSNVIRKSTSPWSSRIVLVKKKDGKLRFCIDYRGLNKLTKKDVYPLPRIDDSLAILQKGQYFSTLDLYAGYWQIPLDENSKEKTAFSTDSGLYEFNVMPFGLCNAPATFQRFMDATMAGLKWKTLLVYMDDIIVFSATFNEHLNDLEEVFIRLKDANITLNLNKCSFFRKKIKYLGHTISREGVQPCRERVQGLINKQSPTSIKELRTWLGMISYYRNFIPQFSKRCASLYHLTHNDVTFTWTAREELILQEMKNYLASEPILRHPNFSYPFLLRTDASIDGLGAVLSQIINNEERIILYISRTVQPNEKNWSIQQLEALGIIWACETVRPYIIGTRVLIITDHKSLQWLKESKIPRLVRWACRLEEFDYEIVYQPGKFNTVADALSRLPAIKLTTETCRKYPSIEIGYNLQDEQLAEINVLTHFNLEGISQNELYDKQLNDIKIKNIIQKLNNNDKATCDTYIIIEGLVYKTIDGMHLLLIPESVVKTILTQYHSHALGGHMARDRLLDILKSRFYWHGMSADVKDFINKCDLCQKIKSQANLRHGRLRPIQVGKPFDLVGADIAYLPKSKKGYRYVLVTIDYFTNWVEAGLMKSLTAEELIRTFFKIIISRHGCPVGLMSDSGSQLKSTAFSQLCKCFNIQKIESSPYHQQANGKVEKFIGFLKRALALITDPDRLYKWDDMIDHCLFIYRISINRTLADTPFYLMYGRDAILPQDLKFHTYDNRRTIEQIENDKQNYQYILTKQLQEEYTKLIKNREAEQNHYKDYYDLSHVDVTYEIGDKVLVLYDTPIKSCLMPRWEGPFTIMNQIDPVTYRVEDETRITTVHVQRLKLIKRDKIKLSMKRRDDESESRVTEGDKMIREEEKKDNERERERKEGRGRRGRN
jgi:transposase InsO family protein